MRNHFTGQVCCGSQPVSAISPRRMLDYVGHIPEGAANAAFVKGFSIRKTSFWDTITGRNT